MTHPVATIITLAVPWVACVITVALTGSASVLWLALLANILAIGSRMRREEGL